MESAPESEVSSNICIGCRKPKATLDCELCSEPLCRNCVQELPEARLGWIREDADFPAEVSFFRYCGPCYDREVTPMIEKYDAWMEAAKKVTVLPVEYQGPVRVAHKATRAEHVGPLADRDEATLRLAFRAVKKGFEALIDYEIEYKKVRDGGYQHTEWRATAIPATLRAFSRAAQAEEDAL